MDRRYGTTAIGSRSPRPKTRGAGPPGGGQIVLLTQNATEGKGGDVNYIVTVDHATRITATTCGAGTNFDARVWWFRTCPLNETLGPDAQVGVLL